MSMPYTALGSSGAQVSRLVLGTMNFGRVTDEAESFAILDRARDAGINVIDTANTYGTPRFEGATESLLGRWFAARPGARESIVLATKVFGPVHPWPNGGGLSAVSIGRAVEESLRRLGTDHIDLYQFHHIDRNVRWEELWQAVDRLIQQGKVTYLGTSNFPGWSLVQGNLPRRLAFLPGTVTEQSLYNPVVRGIEREVIPAAEQVGVKIIPWSPLHGGLLSGAAPADRVRSLEGIAAERREELAARVDAFAELAREIGSSAPELALAWLLHQPQVLGPIIGPRTPEQLETALRAVSLALDAATLDRVDEIFPPVGPAPESYAW